MKIPSLQSLKALILLLTLGSLQTCKENPCKEVECHNGTCIEGNCLCDQHYEGVNCEVEVRQKFLGFWESSTICVSGSSVHDCEIVAVPAGLGKVEISNLNNQGHLSLAEVSGDTINLPLQAFGINTIAGNGGINAQGTEITIYYVVTNPSGTSQSCIATLRKQ